MPQIISTNVMSLHAQRNLDMSQDIMRTAVQRLSSGLRILTSKDDAAGMAITERYTDQIMGIAQASRNAADGISLAQTAEGGLAEVASNLQRIRELAIQSANGTIGALDRASIQEEIVQLQDEMVRVLDGTEFNGVLLFAVSTELTFQVGANNVLATNQVRIKTNILKNVSGMSLALSANALTVTGAISAITRIDMAIEDVSRRRTEFGTTQNRFESVIRHVETMNESLSASRSRIQDADYARETAELTRVQILQDAGITMLAQSNQLPQKVLGLLQG